MTTRYMNDAGELYDRLQPARDYKPGDRVKVHGHHRDPSYGKTGTVQPYVAFFKELKDLGCAPYVVDLDDGIQVHLYNFTMSPA